VKEDGEQVCCQSEDAHGNWESAHNMLQQPCEIVIGSIWSHPAISMWVLSIAITQGRITSTTISFTNALYDYIDANLLNQHFVCLSVTATSVNITNMG
jgi:hypothetical protein